MKRRPVTKCLVCRRSRLATADDGSPRPHFARCGRLCAGGQPSDRLREIGEIHEISCPAEICR